MQSRQLRTRAIDVARSLVSPGEGAVDPDGYRRYLELIAPGEAPEVQHEMAAMASSGLVVAAIWRALGVESGRLDPPYVLGTATRRLVEIAGEAGAWVPFEEGRYPLPGDVIVLGGSSEGAEHVYTVTSISEGIGVTLESVESGERGAHRRPMIVAKKREWKDNIDIVYEGGQNDPAGRERVIDGFIDITRLPLSERVCGEDIDSPENFGDDTKRLPPGVTKVAATEMVAAMERAWTARFASAPKRESIYVLVAQWALETGWGKAMHAYNVGNLKSVEGDGHDYTYFACDEYIHGKQVWFYPDAPGCRFRAYETLDLGAADYLDTLHERYQNTWDAVLAGDPASFARHLKAARYYTGDEGQYTRSLVSIARELSRTGAPVGPAGLDLHTLLGAQKALKELGYDPGTLDGKPGPHTTSAVAAFQRANGLLADGSIGSATREALAVGLSRAASAPTDSASGPKSTPADTPSDAGGKGPATSDRSRHTIPPRAQDAISGSEFFRRLGDKEGRAREEAAKEQLLAGNIPDFLRHFVEVKLSASGHKGSVWVSPDVLAIGSDEDFIRIPLTPRTAQEVQDYYSTTFVTTKLSDVIHAQAAVKLEPIPQSAWYHAPPDHNMETNAFYTMHQVMVEKARAGKRLGALTAGVKKDVCLSIKLNKAPQQRQLGRDAVVIYGWHHLGGERIQGESDIHENTYVDYSHGIRLVSTDMVVDGRPMNLFDVLENKELAPLLLKPLDILDLSYPPPRRYPRAPSCAPYKAKGAPSIAPREPGTEAARRGRSVCHAARFELARGVARHGKGNPWAVTPNAGPIVDDYQRAAGVLDAHGHWGIEQSEAHWCGNFCGFNYRKAGFDMEGKLEGRLNSAGGVPARKGLIFWSTLRLDHYWKHREGCERLAFPDHETSMTREECIAWLKAHLHPFAPRPGDVLLVTTIRPMAHVAMVASYTPETFELITYEGNFSRRGAAVRWDLSSPGPKGFHRINVIGRFPEADFVRDPDVPCDADSPDPEIEGAQEVSGRHDDDPVKA
jgi:hypothetical protein